MQGDGLEIGPGTVLRDTYRIVRRIGAGGMGDVYEAAHARLSGRYAVKVLHREAASNPEAFARFQREAKVTSALRHPNIVRVIDFNATVEGTPYLVMEFLDGIDLATLLMRTGPMRVPRVIEIARQIAAGLSAAHSQGIVHRDLKPQNVILVPVDGQDAEFAKIVDFGISKVRTASKNLTHDSEVMGTPQYMSPEQALGKRDEVDQRSDQFALAAMIYEMLTGRVAFSGETSLAVMHYVVHGQPQPIGILAPWVAPAIAAVLARALSKKKTDRYPSILDFGRALVGAGAEAAPPGPEPTGTTPHTSATSPQTTVVVRRRRGRIAIGIAAGAALATLAVVVRIGFASSGAPLAEVAVPRLDPLARAPRAGAPPAAEAAVRGVAVPRTPSPFPPSDVAPERSRRKPRKQTDDLMQAHDL